MNPSIPLTNEEIDAVLLDFADATAQSAAGKGGTLAEWSARYPALVGDFGRIAEENWSRQNETGFVAGRDNTASAARFREIGRAALFAARPTYQAMPVAQAAPVAQAMPVAQTAPLQDLLQAARERGLSRQTLAARLQLPDPLVLKLHRRLIHAASIPAELVEKLAEAVGRTTSEIAAYLQQPAQMPHAASFRSDAAPQTQTETFHDALRTDPDATPAHKAAWLRTNDSRSGDAA